MRRSDYWATENVENAREDWSWADLLISIPLAFSPILRRRRPLYGDGVAAVGSCKIVDYPKRVDIDDDGVPINSYFKKDREFNVVLRFSNRTQSDDASLDIRGCAFELSGAERHSKFVLLMATGSFAPASSLRNFGNLLPCRSMQRRMAKNRFFREGMAAGMRRAPASYCVLSYFHQTVLEWLTPDSYHVLVRFRLVPSDDSGADRGVPDEADLSELWKQERRTGESRSKTYLRSELLQRLKGDGTADFKLQAQFHSPKPGDSIDWYDASLEWNELTHPWYTIGEVELNGAINQHESEFLHFDPKRLPESLRLPKPFGLSSFDDPRTLAKAQYGIAGLLGWLRTRKADNQITLPEIPDSHFEPAPSSDNVPHSSIR